MVRFGHLADVHLGGWKQAPLHELNIKSFEKAIEICINKRLDFILISGDLFDTAFPGIEVLKEAFAQFRRLKEAGIPCFIIAGSHDYSVSGKTFLDVLEKAGFCKNVENFEDYDNKIILNPTLFGNISIYGYSGRKAGLEVAQLRRIKLNDTPGLFKILMLHTTLDKAKGSLPIDSIESELLPQADYYALGHLHIDFQYEKFIYPGPIFPNNFQELEDLNYGSFYVVDTEGPKFFEKIEIKLKEIAKVEINLKNALNATEKIISSLKEKEIDDKIVLLRLKGEIEVGGTSDIKYDKIEDFAKKEGAYFLLKNTHELKTKETAFEIEISDSEDIEQETIKAYCEENSSPFNLFIDDLMHVLAVEKQEGETNENFTQRLLEGSKKILKF